MELFYAIIMVVHAFISSDFHCKEKYILKIFANRMLTNEYLT